MLQHTDALPGGPLEVLVYGGADGAFVLVEDDGETTAYASGNGVRRTSLAWDDGAATLSWSCKGAAAAAPLQLHDSVAAPSSHASEVRRTPLPLAYAVVSPSSSTSTNAPSAPP